MPIGTVKFFSAAKGFGFITPDEGSKDVFVPAASVASAGVASLKPGQRVSFESAPDGKGPKAVNLTLIANPNPLGRAMELASPVVEKPPAQLTFFLDAADEKALAALADLRAAGYEPRIVDYIAAPPTRDELKSLSFLLRDGSVSLVRKYDPLFYELRLDDRFLSENEFWDSIVEHPSLINGPIAATATKAGILRSNNAVDAFLAAIDPAKFRAPRKEAAIPEETLRLVKEAANVVRIRPGKQAGEPESVQAPAAPKAGKKVRLKAEAAPAFKPKAAVKPSPKTKATKSSAKPKVKKAVSKPAKKPRGTVKK